MSEERSMGDKGKQAVRRAGKAVKTATDTLSGKNVEQQIAEYSETYTQVLLGLHQDIEAQNRKLDTYSSEIEALKHQVATKSSIRDVEEQERILQTHNSDIEMLKRQAATIRRVRILSVAALIIALASAGGALWVAL